MPSDTPAVLVENLGKVYRIYDKPADRLKQLLWPGTRSWGREFKALEGVDFALHKGEVLGLVGKNGAGKSTLLQMICGTLTPTSGRISVHGRIAALLELGAGFNPDFTGRENVYLNGALLGLSQKELDERYQSIVDFSGIGNFIDQPVKTYSSGMYVRLAFSIATSVDPDVLVVDEALSVGDGEFARKSFDRIMELKARGTTILFCSHSLFQVESICTKAIWLNQGRVAAHGDPAQVVAAYQEFLDHDGDAGLDVGETLGVPAPKGHARLQRLGVNGVFKPGSTIALHSLTDTLEVQVGFTSDPNLPTPSVAVTVNTMDGRLVSSAGSWNDGEVLTRNATGQGEAVLTVPRLPLLKGRYWVSAFLFCERGLHWYAVADRAFVLDVRQEGLEQGLVHMTHSWRSVPVEARGGGTTAMDALSWLNECVWPMPVGSSVAAIPQRWTSQAPSDELMRRFGLNPTEAGGWEKTKQPRWRLSWIGPQHRVAWMKLFRAAFGHDMPLEMLEWKYQNAPHWGVGAFAGEQLVAFYGGMPRAMRYRGQKAMAVQIGDVMVHPEYRGLMTRQGAFQMAAATFLEQLIGHERPYLLGYGFPAFKSMALARHLGLYEQVDCVDEWRWSVKHARRNLKATCEQMVEPKADVINELWSQMALGFRESIVCDRNADYMAQRYYGHPTHVYTVLLVKTRWTQNPLGVVVLHQTASDTYEIMDWIADPQNVGWVLNQAGLHVKSAGGRWLTAWITSSHAHLMKMPMCETSPTGLVIPTNSWSMAPTKDEVKNRWFLMGGDTDYK